MFGLDGDRFCNEGLGWVGGWGCCGGPLCLLPLGFGFGITLVLRVIWDDICGVGGDG